ncbi:MAG: hypothetical protein U1E67_21090 [Hyphomicrobiales bacterium]
MTFYLLVEYYSVQVTEAMLRARSAPGDIPKTALAWAPGSATWRPVAEIVSAIGEPDRASEDRRRESTQFWPALILVAMITWSVATATSFFALWDYLPSSVSASTAFLLHMAVLALGAILMIAATIYFWRRPTRRAGIAVAGVLFLIALSTSIVGVTVFVGNAIQARDLYPVFVAQDALENATVFRGSDGTVYIMGSLGPRLVDDFMKAEMEGPVKRVEITSPGGLVSSSLTLAAHLEEHKLPVIVRAYCFSACIHIAVASPESYADRGAIFGFHRTTPIVALDAETFAYADAQANQEAADFLKAHGVPDTVLAIAHKHAGDSIYEVTADEMVDYGAIKGTVSGTKVIRTGNKR